MSTPEADLLQANVEVSSRASEHNFVLQNYTRLVSFLEVGSFASI